MVTCEQLTVNNNAANANVGNLLIYGTVRWVTMDGYRRETFAIKF